VTDYSQAPMLGSIHAPPLWGSSDGYQGGQLLEPHRVVDTASFVWAAVGNHEVAGDHLRKAASGLAVPGRRFDAGRRAGSGLYGQHDLDRRGARAMTGSELFDEPPHGDTDGRLSEALQVPRSPGARPGHRRRPWGDAQLRWDGGGGAPAHPKSDDQDGEYDDLHGLLDSGIERRFPPQPEGRESEPDPEGMRRPLPRRRMPMPA
jgi:hypothetical protein